MCLSPLCNPKAHVPELLCRRLTCLLTEQKISYCKVLPDRNIKVSNNPVPYIKKLTCGGRQVQNLLESRTVNLKQDCAKPRGPPQIRRNSKQAGALLNNSTVLEGSSELCLHKVGAERSPKGPVQCQVPCFLSAGMEEPLRKWSIIICLFLQ